MDIIDRMKESIVKLFPDITDDELKSRIDLTIDMLKIDMFKKYTYQKDKTKRHPCPIFF